jgi:hypothetical protein
VFLQKQTSHLVKGYTQIDMHELGSGCVDEDVGRVPIAEAQNKTNLHGNQLEHDIKIA